MLNLLQAEFYKLMKKKFFIVIFLFSSLSLFYALGMKFNWKMVSVSAKDVSLFIYLSFMWKMQIMFGIPLIYLSYTASNMFSSEIINGQILLEITKVASRRRLLIAKFLTMVLGSLIYLISFFFCSIIFYLTFIWKSSYGVKNLLYPLELGKNLALTSLCDLFFIIALIAVAMIFSISKPAFTSAILTFTIYIVLKLLSYIDTINFLLPGYFSLVNNAEINFFTISCQLMICSTILFLCLKIAIIRFNKKNF
jgi:ABC-2 type transport system permease protein